MVHGEKLRVWYGFFRERQFSAVDSFRTPLLCYPSGGENGARSAFVSDVSPSYDFAKVFVSGIVMAASSHFLSRFKID